MAQTCGGKTVDMIGSGYNKEILPHAWFALISGLADFSTPIEEPAHIPTPHHGGAVLEDTQRMIQELKKMLKGFWNCLGK